MSHQDGGKGLYPTNGRENRNLRGGICGSQGHRHFFPRGEFDPDLPGKHGGTCVSVEEGNQ